MSDQILYFRLQLFLKKFNPHLACLKSPQSLDSTPETHYQRDKVLAWNNYGVEKSFHWLYQSNNPFILLHLLDS